MRPRFSARPDTAIGLPTSRSRRPARCAFRITAIWCVSATSGIARSRTTTRHRQERRPGMNLAQTQDTPAARKEAVVQFLKRTAAEISARSLTEFQSLEAWERQRPDALREVRYMLGLDPLPERTPLHAQ